MKKKAHNVITSINFGIFPGYCLFTSGFSYDEIIKDLKKKKADEWVSAIAHDRATYNQCIALNRTLHSFKNGIEEKREMFFIHLTSFDFSDNDYCKLAHECLHIVQFYLPDILDRNREFETEAYLHTHLMKQCLKALR